MSSILCLAHFCDTHGPTPLMVTEALPVGCGACFEEDEAFGSRRPSTSSRSLNPQDGLAGMVRGASRTNSSSSDQENRVFISDQSSKQQASSSAIETPPESPRVAALQSGQNGNSHRRDSTFRKTYDENDRKRAIPCENCSLTLPKKTKEDESANSRLESNSEPILRTRKPYERVLTPIEEPSPPKSAESSDSESAVTSRLPRRSHHMHRATSSSTNSSFNSSGSHDHFLDYTSTHQPLASASYSMIRQSCLRTLSCENVPPSTQYAPTSSPTSPYMSSPFSDSPSSAARSFSGGPIFFGDSRAGYTTGFTFRVPDPNSRGRHRKYALMALSTHPQRVAMQSFSFLTNAFRDIAAWIQQLAGAENERLESLNSSPRIGHSEGSRQSAFSSSSRSSFLQGRSRGGDGGYSGSINLRSKGLAELVGLPDFFIELHARFVRLLIELSLVQGA